VIQNKASEVPSPHNKFKEFYYIKLSIKILVAERLFQIKSFFEEKDYLFSVRKTKHTSPF
jgi:hypothetical protein